MPPATKKPRRSKEEKRAFVMTDRERITMRIILDEMLSQIEEKALGMAVADHLEMHLRFERLLPFIESQQVANEAKTQFWTDLRSAVGLDTRKKRLRILVALLIFSFGCLMIGKADALKLVMSFF